MWSFAVPRVSESQFCLIVHDCLCIKVVVKFYPLVKFNFFLFQIGGSVAERLERWTRNPVALSSSPALTAS